MSRPSDPPRAPPPSPPAPCSLPDDGETTPDTTADETADTTDGFLFDGRIRYRQRRAGHRTGIEPVLLAAAVPARPGEHVLEGGTGAGAGLLCLLARVPGARGSGIEADPALARLARLNLALNGWTARATVDACRLPALPALAPVQHAFANPPWFDPAATPSPDRSRRLARVLPRGALGSWVGALAGALVRSGTLSLVLRASLYPDALAAFEDAGCGAPVLCPLWPRAGAAARLVILRARKGARGAATVSPGLVLHQDDGRWTDAATAVLRGGMALLP